MIEIQKKFHLIGHIFMPGIGIDAATEFLITVNIFQRAFAGGSFWLGVDSKGKRHD